MILLNKFLFAATNWFDDDLSYHDETLGPKRIYIIDGYDSAHIFYRKMNREVSESDILFKSALRPFDSNKTIEFKYMISYYLYKITEISFKIKSDSENLCGLITDPDQCHNNVFLLSDEKSIANIMNIIRKE